uniref:Uncharacterized protein n=1 Tax=Dromaius novaehollandiae TaxID=8790 RepID=A0A8C4P9H6_DRONO
MRTKIASSGDGKPSLPGHFPLLSLAEPPRAVAGPGDPARPPAALTARRAGCRGRLRHGRGAGLARRPGPPAAAGGAGGSGGRRPQGRPGWGGEPLTGPARGVPGISGGWRRPGLTVGRGEGGTVARSRQRPLAAAPGTNGRAGTVGRSRALPAGPARCRRYAAAPPAFPAPEAAPWGAGARPAPLWAPGVAPGPPGGLRALHEGRVAPDEDGKPAGILTSLCVGLGWEPCSRAVEQVHLRCTKGSLEWVYPASALRIVLEPSLSVAWHTAVCVKPASDFQGASIYVERAGQLHLLVSEAEEARPCHRVALFLQASPQRDIAAGQLASSVSFPRTCTTHLLLHNQLLSSSRLVVKGSVQNVSHSFENHMSQADVSVQKVYRQKNRIFQRGEASGEWQGRIRTLMQCKAKKGAGDFVFTRNEHFGKAWLGCAPWFKDFTYSGSKQDRMLHPKEYTITGHTLLLCNISS